MSLNALKKLTCCALCLAFLVISLGAYTRLTDAGLGCPDWPGCYGHMVPSVHYLHLDGPYATKAWTEMIHRYAAGSLALLIVIIAMRSFFTSLPKLIPGMLLGLVIFQALLGMWTVTLKLLPIVVLGHLLGGMMIFSLLAYLYLQLRDASGARKISKPNEFKPSWSRMVTLGVVIVFAQIALGGWVSSNYAGLACIGFPQCNGIWFPKLHFSQGFNLFSPVGENYQGGVLENDIRMSIQFIHRLGAMLTVSYVSLLSLLMFISSSSQRLRRISVFALFLVTLQFSLGIINVEFLLPLVIAVAHNAVAALLLVTLLCMRYVMRTYAR